MPVQASPPVARKARFIAGDGGRGKASQPSRSRADERSDIHLIKTTCAAANNATSILSTICDHRVGDLGRIPPSDQFRVRLIRYGTPCQKRHRADRDAEPKHNLVIWPIQVHDRQRTLKFQTFAGHLCPEAPSMKHNAFGAAPVG